MIASRYENGLCESEENRVLDFLTRYCAHLPQGESYLGALDFYKPDTQAYGADVRRVSEPDFAAFGDEYFGPFTLDASDRTPGEYAPNTMQEAVRMFFSGTITGSLDFGYRTLAINETKDWELDDTPLKGVPVFGLYFIREHDSFANFLENVFCYVADLPSVNDYGQSAPEAYLDGEGSDLTYNNGDSPGMDVATLGDATDCDRRMNERGDLSARYEFSINVDDVDLNALRAAEMDDASDVFDVFREEAARATEEPAREYFQGNQVCPRNLMSA